MKTVPHISVIIVSYNVRELVLTCLQSIYMQTNTDLIIEVIVVDNDSKDDTVAAIRRDFPEVILIANKNNAGFPKANNQGFEIAKSQYLFMLNPDTELIEDSLQIIWNYMEAHREISLLSPKLLNTDRSHQISAWKYPSLWSVFCETHYLHSFLKKKNYLDHNFDESFEVESFSGAAIFFRREILLQIGLLDESMFWIEDVDFCYRARKAGLRCLYFSETRIVHHIGQSAKKNYNISISNQVVNKIKFFRKHYSRIRTFLVVLLSFYHVILKLLIFGLLSPFKKTYYRKAKAYVYTIPRVFNPPKGIS